MRRKWSNELAPWFRTFCRRTKFDTTCNDMGSFPARGKSVEPDMTGCRKKSQTESQQTPSEKQLGSAWFVFPQSIITPAACIICCKYLETSHNGGDERGSLSYLSPVLCKRDQCRSRKSDLLRLSQAFSLLQSEPSTSTHKQVCLLESSPPCLITAVYV